MVAIRNATAEVTDQDRANVERDDRHQNDEEQYLRLSGQRTPLIGVFAISLVGVVRTISITITDETSINAVRIRETIEATGGVHACFHFQGRDCHGEFRQWKLSRSMIDDLQSFRIEKEFATDRRIAVNRSQFTGRRFDRDIFRETQRWLVDVNVESRRDRYIAHERRGVQHGQAAALQVQLAPSRPRRASISNDACV